MVEAFYLCDRLVVMDNGKILVEGTPRELIQEHVGDQVVEVRVTLSEKANVMDDLRSKGLDFDDRGDSLFLYGGNGAISQDSDDLAGYQVVQRSGNLEDVFLRLTGRGLREE